MTRPDTHSQARTAQTLSVDVRRVGGTPPAPTWGAWSLIYKVSAELVIQRAGGRSSEAVLYVLDQRFDGSPVIGIGDIVRVRTDHVTASDRGCIFSGLVTGRIMDFAGGDDSGRGAHDTLAFKCRDWRWRLSTSSTIFGQYARGESDYNNYGSATQSPKDQATFFSGRRCVFNPNRCKNRDAVNLDDGTPLFHDATRSSASSRAWWTAKQMIQYCLGELHNAISDQFPSGSFPYIGLSHTDWDKVLHGVSVEGLDPISAIELIASQIGWNFREDYTYDGTPYLYFYKVGEGSGIYSRGDVPVVSHDLHVPAVNESISDIVHADGPHMVCAGRIDEDITRVVNCPKVLGAPDEFEVTLRLVPGWKDSDLSYVEATPYYSESDCLSSVAAQASSFYQYYHTRGASFRRNVGRKWVLNEAGDYTAAATYNRGRPFDWTTVIPEAYQTVGGKLAWGPFTRQLIECLTLDDEELSSIGMKVEFSFDGGSTWKSIPCAIRSLAGEAGIYIEEPNLSAILYDSTVKVGTGTGWNAQQLNYFTSLCDDKKTEKVWVNSPTWRTRVRVTATVRMDMRMGYSLLPGSRNGSPIDHQRLYDLSDRYGLKDRTASSVFTGVSHVWEQDSATDGRLLAHAEAIRDANEDMSISGRFTLDRLWLGEGTGYPHFMCGDVVAQITGRTRRFSTDLAGAIHPEIVEIQYDMRRQKQTLLTRDFRFEEARL